MRARRQVALGAFLVASAGTVVFGLVVIWRQSDDLDVSWRLSWSAFLLMIVTAITVSVFRVASPQSDS